jgi:hypothetical protein
MKTSCHSSKRRGKNKIRASPRQPVIRAKAALWLAGRAQDPWAWAEKQKTLFRKSVLHLICSHSRPLACKLALAVPCYLEPLRQEAQGLLCFLLLRIGGGQLDLGRREKGRPGERVVEALRDKCPGY